MTPGFNTDVPGPFPLEAAPSRSQSGAGSMWVKGGCATLVQVFAVWPWGSSVSAPPFSQHQSLRAGTGMDESLVHSQGVFPVITSCV
jgi:hypothetical protein